MKDELNWLTGASAADTQYYAKRATDIAILKEALDIVKGSGQKTKARHIESRIRQLEKGK